MRCSIRSALCMAFAIAFLSAWRSSAEETQSASSRSPGRLNVLFLISDDLRPELGCYGNSIIQTPSIDRLAAGGMVFTRAYCQQSVCSPSRTSVMTGVRPDTSKVWDLNTHFRKALPNVVTLPQLFKRNGYTTQGLGKIYHGSKLDDAPSWSRPSIAAARPLLGNGFVAMDAADAPIPLTKTDRGPAFRIARHPPNGGSDGRVADEAIHALRDFKESGEPFFLAVGFRKPHLPFSVPKEYWDLYDPDEIPQATNRFLPKDSPEFAMVPQNEMWKYSGVPDTSHLPDDYARSLKHGYYAAVSYMDAQLGRVTDELERLGLAGSTIVVLWGDHGWKLGEHDRWCKHSNVEDDTRAPLIISMPGMKNAGTKTQALVEFVDIYPTLAELAGLQLPSHLEGLSLLPLLDDPNREWKPAAFSQYPRSVRRRRLMGYSMRTDRYRFTRWVNRYDKTRVVATELYDHENDPQENENIANDPANAELVAKLAKQWEAGWQAARTAVPSLKSPARE